METSKTVTERRGEKSLSEVRASEFVMGIQRAIDVYSETKDAKKAARINVRDGIFLSLRQLASFVLPDLDPIKAFRKSLKFRKDDSLAKIRALFVEACDICMTKDVADAVDESKERVKKDYEQLKEIGSSDEAFYRMVCLLGLDDGKRRNIF